MLLTFDILKTNYLPDLNRRKYTADDFWQITSKKQCAVFEMRLRKKGYYATNGRENYIFLKYRLRELAWLEAAFHELIHLLIHHPCKFLHRKHQKEARAFALIAMFPKDELPQIVAEFGTFDEFTQYLIYKRLKILDKYGL
jgi:Zn-dependent peptidase ImmA (M78 family)